MAGFKKILVPLDFSECSLDALGHAVSIAGKYGAELHLLHVVEAPFYLGTGVSPGVYLNVHRMEAEMEREASKAMGELAVEIEGVEARQVLKRGPASTEIIKVAEELKADLIVMGTHGRTGLDRLLMGSVAERVVRTASCPVLAVKPKGFKF